MKDPNKSILGTVLLVVLVGYGIYSTVTSRLKLGNCSFPGNARVLFTNKNLGKSPTVHYEYTVEGKRHESSEILPKYHQRSDFPTGKKIKVIVACQDHDLSKIELIPQ